MSRPILGPDEISLNTPLIPRSARTLSAVFLLRKRKILVKTENSLKRQLCFAAAVVVSGKKNNVFHINVNPRFAKIPCGTGALRVTLCEILSKEKKISRRSTGMKLKNRLMGKIGNSPLAA
jgi:hypothetical protein